MGFFCIFKAVEFSLSFSFEFKRVLCCGDPLFFINKCINICIYKYLYVVLQCHLIITKNKHHVTRNNF